MSLPYVELIAALAIAQYLHFGALTGRARRDSGLKAPAITGHEGFEKMYRVQMNTMETMVAFLPSLFLAANHWPAVLVAALGAVYLVGRYLYWRGYVSSTPSKRGTGFMLSIVPTIILLVMAIAGTIISFPR
jgi:glutathione S-transferase